MLSTYKRESGSLTAWQHAGTVHTPNVSEKLPHLAEKLAECEDVENGEIGVTRIDHILSQQRIRCCPKTKTEEGDSALLRRVAPQKRMPEPSLNAATSRHGFLGYIQIKIGSAASQHHNELSHNIP